MRKSPWVLEAGLWLVVVVGPMIWLVWAYRLNPLRAAVMIAAMLPGLATLVVARITLALATYTKTYASETTALVTATQAAMRAQLRPVVVARFEGQNGLRHLSVSNLGVGPATNVRVPEAWYRIAGNQYVLEPDTDRQLALCLAPHEQVSKLPRLNRNEKDPGTENEILMGAHIRISYRDVYGQRFESVLDNGNWTQNGLFEP